MDAVLSLWRSPLDKVALAAAEDLCARQPRGSIGYGEDFHLMTIYNFGYYIDNYGPGANTALQQMLTDMSGSPAGGLGFIPQENFQVDTSLGSFEVPDQSVIVGSGGGGTAGTSVGSAFFHFTFTPHGPAVSAAKFLDCNPTGHSTGGIYFRGLSFQWGTSSFADDTCIAAGVENVRAIRCTFTDCPTAFNADGVSCALEQCTISYTVSQSTGPNGTNAVILRAAECAVLGPGVFSQTSQAPVSGGATGCTCIAIQGAEHIVVAAMQILDWATGIDFSQGPTGNTLAAHITNCEIACWQHALKIVLPNGSSAGAGIKVTSCTLTKASDSTDSQAIVKLDANSGSLHDVTLLDCTVFNMASAPSGQHGVTVASGADIKIIGGTYSANGGAGIAITGAATDVQIIGATLRPTYPAAPSTNSQQYALLIGVGANPANVLVSGCDMTGYGAGGPVSVPGSLSHLLITDCPGYNDVSTALYATGAQLTGGVGASTCNTPYYGPSVIAYSHSSAVALTVFGQTITAAMGIIFLPTPADSFSFNTVPLNFSWTGK